MAIKTVWLDHIKSQDEREKFKKTVTVSLNDVVFTKFKSILNNKLLSLEDKEISEDSYKDKDWAFAMAHRNGYKQALIEVMTLITNTDKT